MLLTNSSYMFYILGSRVSSTQSNGTSLFWAFVRYITDGLEIESIICYNFVDPSSAGTPTSTLLVGDWWCKYYVALAGAHSVSVDVSTTKKNMPLGIHVTNMTQSAQQQQQFQQPLYTYSRPHIAFLFDVKPCAHPIVVPSILCKRGEMLFPFRRHLW